MRRQVLAVLAVAALLAGCKSTGIALNPPNGGNVVTLVISGSPVIAYQDTLNGAWKLLPANQTQFTVTGGTAYGVAFTCAALEPSSSGQRVPQGSEWTPTAVIQATTTEINTIPVPCGETDTEVFGTFDASAFAGTSYGYVDYESEIPSSVGDYEIIVPPGVQDIFAAAYNDDDDVIAFKTLQSVNVPETGLTGENVTLTASDAVGTSQNVAWTNAPDWSPYSWVDFGSYNETLPLADGDGTSLSYPTVAASDVGSDDVYVAESAAGNEGDGSEQNAEAGAYGQTLPSTIAYPHLWDASAPSDATRPAFTLNYGGFSGVSGGFGAYAFEEDWGTIEDEQGVTFALVSFGYVHAAHISSYTAPDITLAGFSDMVPASGDVFFYDEAAVYSTPIILSEFYYGVEDTGSEGQRGAQSLSQRPASWRQAQSTPAGARTFLSGTRIQSNSQGLQYTSGVLQLTETNSCMLVGGGTCEF